MSSYTKEQLRTMPPGVDIDRLVAKFVMGWDWQGNRAKIAKPPVDGWEQTCWFEFKPSTRIADAWMVVERIKSWEPNIDYIAERPGWVVFFDQMTGDWSAHADTAPLAICRAVLCAQAKPA